LQATWGVISRRAWLGSRALDWAITLPQIDKERICITGHSRNGKQSMIATAFDDRITAVVSSSSGVPASSVYRFSGRPAYSESPEDFLSYDGKPWFLESLRKFNGYENELPMFLAFSLSFF